MHLKPYQLQIISSELMDIIIIIIITTTTTERDVSSY